MDKAVTEWMQEVVSQDNKRVAWEQARYNEVVDKGGRWITWTGGGNGDENRVYDRDTGELLAVTEDTIEAFEEAWQDDWHNPDPIGSEAYDLFPDPDMPEEFAFLLDDNYDPEVFKEYLQRVSE